ncbi:unnamed protein product [Clonostachys rosea]|uniref:FAD/NAD(P)-binding domain-containing protein n=1 Tax=Bionectria ochroleuca TaxID=29856 RepID=A0ABY6UXS1_BIOOC|nr:unnamed protein product [Clonostachys rosea]
MTRIEDSFLNVPIDQDRAIKVVCIGAGFSGILCGIRLPQKIANLDLTIYEKNDDFGGTWLENNYQYTFAGNPNWSKFYSSGGEILSYLKGTAWRYDVQKYVHFQHFFKGATWNEDTSKWAIKIQNMKTGETFEDMADILIRGTGLLNKWKWPQIEGLHTFKGDLMHTANFDPAFDWSEKRVALIGAGSTGIQILPHIQPRAKKIFHYVRGKTWISPVGYGAEMGGGGNFEYSNEQRQQFAKSAASYQSYRHKLEEVMNKGQLVSIRGSDIQKQFWVEADAFMKKKLEKKPEIYKALLPSFPPGCRRLTPGPGYLDALLEDNVRFIGGGVTRVDEKGILDQLGNYHEVDAIICATGFDYTFSTQHCPIVGRNGITLDDMYKPGPQAYMGIAVPYIPNHFMFLGPASAPASGSFIPTLELVMSYIIKCIQKLQRESYSCMEPTMEALEDFNSQADKYFSRTVFSYKCSSFFKGDKDEGRVTTIWPGSATHYMRAAENPRWEDFRWKLLPEAGGNRMGWLGNGLTVAQQEGLQTSSFLDDVDIPPTINHYPSHTNGYGSSDPPLARTPTVESIIPSAISSLPA